MSRTSLLLCVLAVASLLTTGDAREPNRQPALMPRSIPNSFGPRALPPNPLAKSQEAAAPMPAPLPPTLRPAVPEKPPASPPLAEPPDEPVVASDDASHDPYCCEYHRATWGGQYCPSLGDQVRACWARTKAHLQWSHWGYPEEFCERPHGAAVRAHLKRQITNGVISRMVLYQYDFRDDVFHDPSKLNSHGRKRLHELIPMLECNIWPLVIECSGNPELDSARLAHVKTLLEEQVGEVPEEWVVVCDPPLLGLCGEEAIIIDENLLRQTRSRATSTPGRPSQGSSTNIQSSSTITTDSASY